jgi:carbonic anhydrase
MKTKDRILLESKAWRMEKISLDKDYFNRLNEMRSPKILWISSSENLVSIREMTNTDPGDIIVYRNIASQVRQDDLSLMAILEDAINVCQVSHIIICGYSHCTGVRDVLLGTDDRPAVKEWLKNLRALYARQYEALRNLPFEQQEKVLNELNIYEQVNNLSRIPCIQRAWEKTDYPKIYGWYFDLMSGALHDILSMEKNHRIKRGSSLLKTEPQ